MTSNTPKNTGASGEQAAAPEQKTNATSGRFEALNALYNKTLMIPGHEKLEWLVALLFSKKFWHRYEGVNKFLSIDANYYAAVTEEIKKDNAAVAFLEKAQKAVEAGEIDIYHNTYLDFDDEQELLKSPQKIVTVSFLIWAEKAGCKIPAEIVESITPFIQLHSLEKQQKETYDYCFPPLSVEKFNLLRKEPLWPLSRGIVFLLARHSKSNPKQEAAFIKTSSIARKLIKYAEDSCKIGNLNFLGYEPMQSVEEQLENLKIEPEVLIEWVQSLPLEMPIFSFPQEEVIQPEPIIKGVDSRKYNSAMKILLTLLIKKHPKDMSDTGGEHTLGKKIEGWAEECGIKIDSKTAANFIKEAKALPEWPTWVQLQSDSKE